MAKDLRLVLLLDCYGELLTPRQRELAGLYYNEDLSLSEIAEMGDITRQAVRDSLRHSERILLDTEEKLGMAERIQRMGQCLDSIAECCREAPPDALQTIADLVREGRGLL